MKASLNGLDSFEMVQPDEMITGNGTFMVRIKFQTSEYLFLMTRAKFIITKII